VLNTTIFKIIQQKYQNRSKIRKLKKLKFRTFKEVISLKAFKARYIKDFYNRKELSKLRKFFAMDRMTVDAALMKRSILNKIITRKYYSLFYLKELPNRFLKRKRKYFKRKLKKKKLNLRVKFFYRITYDTFLFYLNLSNKQIIIKPLNFFNCLFFYKSKKFKKFYVVRKRRRMRFRFYYKFRRRKKRRSVRRRKIKYLKYKFKQKFLMRRFRQIKIRKYKNFLRFISFFNFCKKSKLKVDDYFKTNSILNSPYKLLKFNFNKITNSYHFFLNFNSQRKRKLEFNNTKNILNKEKLKLYNLVKFKLQNRFILNTNSSYNEVLNQSLLKNNSSFFYKAPDYLFETNLININIRKNYQINKSKNNFQNSAKENKLNLFIKKIIKIAKKILFFEKQIINLKTKQKKKLSGLLFKLFKINKKIINKFLKYKQIINVLLDIIMKLRIKLKKMVFNFYFFFNYCNTLNIVKNKTNLNFLKKIMFYLKRKKRRLKRKLKLKKLKKLNKQNKKTKSFIFGKTKFIFTKNKKFRFSYKNKLNNGSHKYFKRLKKKKRRNKALKNIFFKSIKKNFFLSNFFLYKNYFSKKNLRKNNNYAYFGNKKFKYLYLNFLKKTNLIDLKNTQKLKNINFLNN